MSRDLAHLAFFYTFFSISLVCIGFFFFFLLVHANICTG